MGGASRTLTGTVAIALTVLADADGDGTPDDWEIAHGLDVPSTATTITCYHQAVTGALAVTGTGRAWARARR